MILYLKICFLVELFFLIDFYMKRPLVCQSVIIVIIWIKIIIIIHFSAIAFCSDLLHYFCFDLLHFHFYSSINILDLINVETIWISIYGSKVAEATLTIRRHRIIFQCLAINLVIINILGTTMSKVTWDRFVNIWQEKNSFRSYPWIQETRK